MCPKLPARLLLNEQQPSARNLPPGAGHPGGAGLRGRARQRQRVARCARA